MKKNKLALRLSVGILILVLFLIVGGVYTFLSFEMLNSLNVDFGLSGVALKILGVSLLIIGIMLFLLTLLTNFLRKVDRVGQQYWWGFLIFDIVKWIIIVVLGLVVLSGGVGVTQSLIG